MWLCRARRVGGQSGRRRRSSVPVMWPAIASNGRFARSCATNTPQLEENPMRAAVLTEVNKPLQILDLEQEGPKARRGARAGQGRRRVHERLAHHERRLAAAAADGARATRRPASSPSWARASPTSRRATTSSSRSAPIAGTAATARAAAPCCASATTTRRAGACTTAPRA